MLPTRLKFHQLPAHMLPRSDTMSDDQPDIQGPLDSRSLAAVIERWRGRVSRPRTNPAEELRAASASPSIQPAAAPQPAAPLDPNRFRLLKRPLDEQALNAALDRQMMDSGRR
jgi:hypothetical protein